MVKLQIDLVEKKYDGRYYYKFDLCRDGEKVFNQFCREVEYNYSGSRFPRIKEIILATKQRIRQEIDADSLADATIELNWREEDEGSERD